MGRTHMKCLNGTVELNAPFDLKPFMVIQFEMLIINIDVFQIFFFILSMILRSL